MIDVVCAVLILNGRYLVAQKPASKGGDWEFPGGKVEANETLAEALVREIQEELGIAINPCDVVGIHTIDTKNVTYRIHFMEATLLSDEFKLTEHQAYKWVSLEEIKTMNMSSADLEFVKHINTRD